MRHLPRFGMSSRFQVQYQYSTTLFFFFSDAIFDISLLLSCFALHSNERELARVAPFEPSPLLPANAQHSVLCWSWRKQSLCTLILSELLLDSLQATSKLLKMQQSDWDAPACTICLTANPMSTHFPWEVNYSLCCARRDHLCSKVCHMGRERERNYGSQQDYG